MALSNVYSRKLPDLAYKEILTIESIEEYGTIILLFDKINNHKKSTKDIAARFEVYTNRNRSIHNFIMTGIRHLLYTDF